MLYVYSSIKYVEQHILAWYTSVPFAMFWINILYIDIFLLVLFLFRYLPWFWLGGLSAIDVNCVQFFFFICLKRIYVSLLIVTAKTPAY